jgi:hypothetical protein
MTSAALKLGPLFDTGCRIDPPSIAKESSERGAEHAKRLVGGQSVSIMLELERAGAVPGSDRVLSRDELLASIPGLTVNAATGRLGPSGALQTTGRIAVVADAAQSRVGNKVDGYKLTPAGLAWLNTHRHTEP